MQKLVHHFVRILVDAAGAGRQQGVYLVQKDDGRGLGAGLIEEALDGLLALAQPHGVDLGGRRGEERAVGLGGEDAGDGGLAGPRRAEQQQARRRLDAQVFGQRGVLQKKLHLAQFALGAGGQDDIVPRQRPRPRLGVPALRLPVRGGVKRGGAFGVGGVVGPQTRRLRGGLGGGVGLAEIPQGQRQRVGKARVIGVQGDRLPEGEDGLPERLPVLHDPIRLPQRLGGGQHPQPQQGRRQVPQRPAAPLLMEGRRHQAFPPPLPSQPQLERPLRVLREPRHRRLKRRHRPRVFPPPTKFEARLKRRVLGNLAHSAPIIPRNPVLLPCT